MKSSKKMRSVATWLVFGVLGVGACQVVVGETELGQVACEEDFEGACPSGQTCVDNKCETPGASGAAGTGGTGETGGTGGETGGTGGDTGGTGGDTGGTGGDTGGTGGKGGTGGGTGGTGGTATGGTGGTATGGTGGTGVTLKKFGELCSAAEPCEPQLLCLQPEGVAVARCATLCCSSADCADGAVCVPTKVGGTGCFPVTALNRPAPGLGVPGTACSASGECRSASCVGNVCKDVCCKHTSCADGHACAWEGGTYSGWYCSTAKVGDSKGQGATCSGDGECDGRNCFGVLCMGPCCTDADCGFTTYCDYYKDGSELIRQCLLSVYERPGLLQPCCTDADCPSSRCEVITQKVWQKAEEFPWGPVLGDPVPAMRCAP